MELLVETIELGRGRRKAPEKENRRSSMGDAGTGETFPLLIAATVKTASVVLLREVVAGLEGEDEAGVGTACGN